MSFTVSADRTVRGVCCEWTPTTDGCCSSVQWADRVVRCGEQLRRRVNRPPSPVEVCLVRDQAELWPASIGVDPTEEIDVRALVVDLGEDRAPMPRAPDAGRADVPLSRCRCVMATVRVTAVPLAAGSDPRGLTSKRLEVIVAASMTFSLASASATTVVVDSSSGPVANEGSVASCAWRMRAASRSRRLADLPPVRPEAPVSCVVQAGDNASMNTDVPIDLVTKLRRQHGRPYRKVVPCTYSPTVGRDATAFVDGISGPSADVDQVDTVWVHR